MEKCKTCVYWEGSKTSKQAECGLIDEGKGEAFMKVQASDDSGLMVSLVTSPEFGYSLHKGILQNSKI